jgi:hypothetical protein
LSAIAPPALGRRPPRSSRPPGSSAARLISSPRT